MIKHPFAICDGFLPMKVKDEIELKDWVYKIVIPTKIKTEVENFIPENLLNKIIYIENNCKDIWEWTEKVFNTIKQEK